MRIAIQRLDPGLPLPEYQTSGAGGFDIACRQAITIEPDAIAYLPSNLIIEVPADHMLMIVPRSSLVTKKGLIMPNSVGIIDSDFHGSHDEIMIIVKNSTQKPVTIEAGERLAQGIIIPIARAEWVEQIFDGPSRGGFGSSRGYQE